jgi:hypothetical protein
MLTMNKIVSFLLIMSCLTLSPVIHADNQLLTMGLKEQARPHPLAAYLLPVDHPLQAQLKTLFLDPHMFKDSLSFKKAGFKVKKGHQIMVASHSSVPGFLFKKFRERQTQRMQIQNFLKRIEGAKKLRNYIEQHNFQHLVVPKKWLYRLPDNFPKGSYILIVENMDIYDWESSDGIAKELYYNMDRDTLTELCTILHAFGGIDGYPRNQPFTKSGKIALIDTEHVGKFKGHFIKHIVPELNEELQAYALALWSHLEDNAKRR